MKRRIFAGYAAPNAPEESLRTTHRAAGLTRGVTTTIAITAISSLAAVFSSAVHAQSPAPATALIPDGTPVEIVSGLRIPWSAVTIGQDGLVSQRGSAEILRFRPGDTPQSAGTVPDVVARGDGGMLGLATRTEGGNVWLYAYHSTSAGNRIVRMPYAEGTLGDAEIILDGLPGGRAHNGGRIAFGPDGMLYATVGETRNPDLSQDLQSLAGKILRMTPEGDIPDDNPFDGSYVYSFGHRNPQGITWDETGQMWATEFGNDRWDEFNRIVPGGNYGWPVVEGQGDNPDYIDPVLQWPTDQMGPSGLTYIDGTFFIAGLTGQRLWTVNIAADGTPEATDYYPGEYGRIRDVLPGSDGNLWFLTNTRGGGDNGIMSVPLAPSPTP
ncbi:PQQ-dependent sugar dehydrogenase [uncultured Martelella sp.]|uniref:PQQ-dependent sugar dehydrogenase n=1 Tax=uncultured Martelella sp. TaxID=392331 RepID=UPI0029C8C822|nr:PQQ-dependent sugar dehydrogenase [uncultured Martelella sp.]